MILSSINNDYEIVNFKRSDNKYNTYIQKTSKLSGTYIGEAVFKSGCNTQNFPPLEEIINLKFEI